MIDSDVYYNLWKYGTESKPDVINKVKSVDPVTEFENKIAAFFGAPYAVATDSCTSAVELCLRYMNAIFIDCPKRTYLSIPMLASKLNINLFWTDKEWVDYYEVYPNIIDAAVLWKAGSYIPGKFMCISFQYAKHLSIGKAGMILCDNKDAALQLKKSSFDGRLPNIPWRDQNVDCMGYHYYLQPELAQIGLNKLDKAIATEPRQWSINDWPDISQMDVFKNK